MYTYTRFGRNYHLRCQSEEELNTWITLILELRDEEQKRMLHDADTSIIGCLRPHVRTVVESNAFQSFVAVLLFTNFALNIIGFILLHIYTHTHVCINICMYVYTHTHTHKHTHACYMYVCMYVCICIHARAHTHTHTHKRLKPSPQKIPSSTTHSTP
jgi:hypothetical protein